MLVNTKQKSDKSLEKYWTHTRECNDIFYTKLYKKTSIREKLLGGGGVALSR